MMKLEVISDLRERTNQFRFVLEFERNIFEKRAMLSYLPFSARKSKINPFGELLQFDEKSADSLVSIL